jgi:hypothetical protein
MVRRLAVVGAVSFSMPYFPGYPRLPGIPGGAGRKAGTRSNFTVFPAARRFGRLSPCQVNLRKAAVITVSLLVAGRSRSDSVTFI